MSIREELRQIEKDLERIRAEAADLHRQVGDLGPTDPVERSALINMAQEQEALAVELEARREGLLQRLNEE